MVAGNSSIGIGRTLQIGEKRPRENPVDIQQSADPETERFVVRDKSTMQAIEDGKLKIIGYLVTKEILEAAKEHLRKEAFTQGKQYQDTFHPPTFKLTVKSWKCDACGKTFRSKSELRRHGRVHSGERPYPCPECSSRFKQKSHLKVHIDAHHKRRSERTKALLEHSPEQPEVIPGYIAVPSNTSSASAFGHSSAR